MSTCPGIFIKIKKVNGELINIGSCRGPPAMPSRTTRGPRTPGWKPLLYGVPHATAPYDKTNQLTCLSYTSLFWKMCTVCQYIYTCDNVRPTEMTHWRHHTGITLHLCLLLQQDMENNINTALGGVDVSEEMKEYATTHSSCSEPISQQTHK